MEDRGPMSSSVSDVASATAILMAVCVVVIFTLMVICRLLHRGTFPHVEAVAGRCSDGSRCAGGDLRQSREATVAATAVEGCSLPVAAQLPERQSTTSQATANDKICSSKYRRSLS